LSKDGVEKRDADGSRLLVQKFMDDKTRQSCRDQLLGGFLGAIGTFLATACLFLLIWFFGSVDVPASFRKIASTYAVIRTHPRAQLVPAYSGDYQVESAVKDEITIEVNQDKLQLRFAIVNEEPFALENVDVTFFLPSGVVIPSWGDQRDEWKRVWVIGSFGEQTETQMTLRLGRPVRSPECIIINPLPEIAFPREDIYQLRWMLVCDGFSEAREGRLKFRYVEPKLN